VRIIKGLVAAAAATVAALGVATVVTPALADPVNSQGKAVTPTVFDIVGGGSNTDQYLIDQLSVDYNAAHSKVHNASHPWIYSWDATPPWKPNVMTSTIRPKPGCPKITRPNGARALGVLDNTGTTGSHDCIDFARSAVGDSIGNPPGFTYVTLARDAVTYATNASTNAPTNLTTADLAMIYSCVAATWNQVGGRSHAPIDPILPPVSSELGEFFLDTIGVEEPGRCVSQAEDNEGTAAVFRNNKNAIVPFSVGSYIAQAFHMAPCGQKPKAGQDKFGCDAVGNLKLRHINGTAPTKGTGPSTVINTKFTPAFLTMLNEVVHYAPHTADHIPAPEERFFGIKGFFCSAAAAKVIAAYGFVASKLFCGSVVAVQ
jgi:ABC-type phosphate transport system substrate-binding protein